MAANFGVSRNVIREALKILKERQLITLHIGEGAYINKPGDQGVTEMLNRIVLMDNIKPENTFELLQFWKWVLAVWWQKRQMP